MDLFSRLQPKAKHKASPTCLLLDFSGSMDRTLHNCEDREERRIDILLKTVRETPECQGLTTFRFDNYCERLEVIPEDVDPSGSTNLADAFLTIKSLGFFNAILVTDGQPDSPSHALEAAAGLRLGIVYIGDPPVPPFLQQLAKVTDGTFAIEDLSKLQLSSTLTHAIEDMRSKNENKDETIKL